MKKIILLTILILITSGCVKTPFKAMRDTQSCENRIAEQCSQFCNDRVKYVEKEETETEPLPKHVIDLKEEKCLKDADSNYKMRKCVNEAMYDWFLEIDKNMAILQKKLPSEKFKIIENSQKRWKEAMVADFAAKDEVVFAKVGTIYTVYNIGQKEAFVRDRALILESYIHYLEEP